MGALFREASAGFCLQPVADKDCSAIQEAGTKELEDQDTETFFVILFWYH